MNGEKKRKRRIRNIAAICAVLILAGSTAGFFAFRAKNGAQAAQTAQTAQNAMQTKTAGAAEQTVSAGGTVTCAQRTDTLGLVNTNVRLTVESVLAESGDTVTAGTVLYQITGDSLAKAEKTLRSELQSAESTLKKQKAQAQLDESKAGILYESELLLGDTAQQDYSAGLSELNSALQDAYDSYTEALDTVSYTPAEIANKQNALAAKQSEAEKMQAEQKAAQENADIAESAYRDTAESYNSIASEYNSAAAVVRYLGNALGKDVSGIRTAQTVTAEVQKQNAASSEPENPDKNADFSGGFGGDGERPDGMMQSTRFYNAPALNTAEALSEQALDSENDALTALYENARAEFEAWQPQLAEADTALKSAESKYKSASSALTQYSNSLKQIQSEISALEKEISSLESTLSKAQSNLSKLRSEYNSLKASYETDQLALEKESDTELASYENAEYHYQITCSTIEDELTKAQESYDTAAENLRIFEDELADGCIRAQQDGTIYTLNGQAGQSLSTGSAYVSYVDETTFAVTVELDQNDVTEVSIGDSVLIYSSETGIANGKITAISAGTAASLADVRFNVTVTANDNAQLYSGESVNVYFNAGNMKQSDFSDFSGGSAKSESGGGRPDMASFAGFSGGGMPGFSGGSGSRPDISSGGKQDNSSGSRPSFGSGGSESFSGFGSIFGNLFGGGDTKNTQRITLSTDDMDDITASVPGLSEATISYTVKENIYGGNIEESESYTIAGTLSDYADLSNLTILLGNYLTDADNEHKNKVCVLGYTAAKQIFGSASDAYDSIVYIDDRPYTVGGVLAEQGTVESGISADEAIFIPYATGIKYLTGSEISPTITVISADVDNVNAVIENVKTVLAASYPNAEFTFSDAGSKMKAANKSNETLTLMLIAMASIVFIIGGIGIMNVLFVSVKDRTREIGILKAIGGSRGVILLEFLLEACCISLIGGVFGILVSFAVSPVLSGFSIRLEMSAAGALIAMAFSLVTGTVFGFYPAWKASRLVPVEALAAE